MERQVKKRKTTAQRRVSKAQKDNPTIDADSLYEIAEYADKYAALKNVADTEGGQILIDTLFKDAADTCNQLASNYRTYQLSDFQSASAKLAVVLSLAQSLLRAGENLDGAEEALEEALRAS